MWNCFEKLKRTGHGFRSTVTARATYLSRIARLHSVSLLYFRLPLVDFKECLGANDSATAYNDWLWMIDSFAFTLYRYNKYEIPGISIYGNVRTINIVVSI